MNFKEKIVNALYAQAVCDAVGNEFEFETNINPEDVILYANNTDELIISDDTQMALFGFAAINHLSDYRIMDKYEQMRESFADHYMAWYITQTENPINHRGYIAGLLSFQSMWSVQAPGMTCLAALKTLTNGGVVKNDSMGCGSVMRLLPLVSLFENHDYETVIEYAKITGAITHKHKDNDTAIRRYMEVAYKIINDKLLTNIHPEVTHISQLGEGWIATECVEMAIYAYIRSNTFDELLAMTCSIDGDSDSVAAIAGSLWGLSGRDVPKKYIEKLDSLDAVIYICDRI